MRLRRRLERRRNFPVGFRFRAHNQIGNSPALPGGSRSLTIRESLCARGWSLLRSPSPQPSPRGEGETFVRALVIQPSLVVVCLRNDRQRSGDCNRNVRTFQRRASALPLLGERVGVRGNRTTAVLAASALESAPERRAKLHGFEPFIISSLRLCRRPLTCPRLKI